MTCYQRFGPFLHGPIILVKECSVNTQFYRDPVKLISLLAHLSMSGQIQEICFWPHLFYICLILLDNSFLNLMWHIIFHLFYIYKLRSENALELLNLLEFYFIMSRHLLYLLACIKWSFETDETQHVIGNLVMLYCMTLDDLIKIDCNRLS